MCVILHTSGLPRRVKLHTKVGNSENVCNFTRLKGELNPKIKFDLFERTLKITE